MAKTKPAPFAQEPVRSSNSNLRFDPFLSVQERCEPVLLHVARVAERFVPALEPWAYLRQHLPARRVPRLDALPHWSRLVSHTGVTWHGGPPQTDWLCRRE